MNDEIIRELRAAKEQLAADAGFDIQRLVAMVQKEELASAAQGRVVLQPSATTSPPSGFQQVRFAPH